jgi:predicted amidophosphoribosyltransferase
MRPQDVILELFKSNKELTVKEIVPKLRQSRQMIHHWIRKLIATGEIERVGHPPNTIYRLKPDAKPSSPGPSAQLSPRDRDFLQNNFLIVTESGKLLDGPPAFEAYCHRRALPIEETMKAYQKAREFRNMFRDRYGTIEGSHQLLGTIGEDRIMLDRLFFFDHYTVRGFGRTRLGTLLYYAKHAQNKDLMKMLMDSLADRIDGFVERLNPDAIAFIPPIVPREVQLINFIQSGLDLSLPLLEIKKTCGTVAVPQQSLYDIDERISNARNIFAITDRRRFGRVLLIDDTMDTGATLNEIATKVKMKGIATEVTGLALVSNASELNNVELNKRITT